jgi:hypothetical protein
MSDFRKWTPEAEADAAGAVARAIGRNAGCRRRIFIGSLVALVLLSGLLLAHIVGLV